jgi:hypothetical protein
VHRLYCTVFICIEFGVNRTGGSGAGHARERGDNLAGDGGHLEHVLPVPALLHVRVQRVLGCQ